jgi:hypothetical protein
MCIVYGIHFVIIHSLNYSDFVSTFSILMIKKISLSLHFQMYITLMKTHLLQVLLNIGNKKMQLTLVCGDLNPSSFVVIFRLGYVI